MTKEDKELLIQDLCARLPYGFIIYRPSDNANLKISDIDDFAHFLEYSDGEEFKPYLRPMSSMTEEEKIKLYQIAGFYYLSNNELLKDEWNQFSCALSENKLFLPYPIWESDLNKAYDWLNAHHFDYRGLINKGLALEALENMYKN